MQNDSWFPKTSNLENKDGTALPRRTRQEITLQPVSNKTFGEPDFTIAAVASSGLPVSFTASGACTINGNRIHIARAGSCTVTAHQDGNDNFEAAADVSHSFSIDPAHLVVKAENKTMMYGGVMPAFSVAVSGLVSSEPLGNLAVKTNALPGSPPGEYALMPGGLQSSDYIIDYVAGTLTIKPAQVIVKADNKTSTYGEALPGFTATAFGLAEDDTFESLGNLHFQTTATKESHSGTYAITPEGLSSPNYTFEYINGKVEILPARLKVEADEKRCVYGEPFPEFTLSSLGTCRRR